MIQATTKRAQRQYFKRFDFRRKWLKVKYDKHFYYIWDCLKFIIVFLNMQIRMILTKIIIFPGTKVDRTVQYVVYKDLD